MRNMITFHCLVGMRLERHGATSQIKWMLHRLGVLLLAFAFVVGLTAQVAAGAWMMNGCPMSMASSDMPAGDTQSDAPCNGLTLACIDALGCAMPTVAPAPPMEASITLKWVAATFAFPDISMSGLSVEPDLTPPILLA